jgi:hypothetical protein
MDIVEIIDRGVLVFEVTWIQPGNGQAVESTYYTNQQLRRYDPDRLLDYYESKLRPYKDKN